MPRPRFLKLPVDRQAQILAVAGAEFAESGYEGASFNRIIEKAGLSKGAMYYYFDDKTDLYVTVLQGVQMKVIEDLGGIDFGSDFWVELERFSQNFVRLTLDRPDLMALMRSFYHLRPSLRDDGPVAELHRTHHDFTEAILRQGRELGAVRDDIPMALLVNAVFAVGEAIDRWFFDHFDEIDEADVPRHTHLMVGLIRRIAEPREKE